MKDKRKICNNKLKNKKIKDLAPSLAWSQNQVKENARSQHLGLAGVGTKQLK